MKAMVLRGPGEPFLLEDRPDPTPGPGEAVARVLACGSGLTIEHVRAGRTAANFPIIIGHEITGEIVAVGPETAAMPVIEPLKDGDPVTCWFYLSTVKIVGLGRTARLFPPEFAVMSVDRSTAVTRSTSSCRCKTLSNCPKHWIGAVSLPR